MGLFTIARGFVGTDSTANGRPRQNEAEGSRLGVYVDTVVDAARSGEPGTVLTNAASLAFLTYVCEVGSQFPGLTIFARQSTDKGADYPLPGCPTIAGLPYYPRVSGRALAENAVATARAMWRYLDDVDHVWVFGPHPFGLLLVLLAIARRRGVTLGVRQETLAYFASRSAPSARRTPLPFVLRLLDASWRLLSRRLPTTVVGASVEETYGGPRPGLFPMSVSLIRLRDLRPAEPPRASTGPIELLTVGRLAPEKNPMLLLEALAILHSRSPGRFRLTWVGDGELRPAVRELAAELGVENIVALPGFVPVGDELLEYYRRADLFVHVAITEAFGQVLIEAQANAIPIVATDVGGVSAVLDNGAAGVLVPPQDVAALVESIDSLSTDPARQFALARRGRELAEGRTLEQTSASTAAFMLSSVERRTGA